jgi:hypothetical protein
MKQSAARLDDMRFLIPTQVVSGAEKGSRSARYVKDIFIVASTGKGKDKRELFRLPFEGLARADGDICAVQWIAEYLSDPESMALLREEHERSKALTILFDNYQIVESMLRFGLYHHTITCKKKGENLPHSAAEIFAFMARVRLLGPETTGTDATGAQTVMIAHNMHDKLLEFWYAEPIRW